jgi:predicted restriction endonuclease
MAFNPLTKKKILHDSKTGALYPCVMCGTTFPSPEAAHIIDKKEWRSKKQADRQVNGMPLCPNCHKVFEEVMRPYLYLSLEEFGATGLPECWKKSNKVAELPRS